MILLDGKKLSEKILEEAREKNSNAKLAVILVGQDPASKVYVRNKNKACEKAGVSYEEYLLDENTTQEELIKLIKELNEKIDVNGILLQSPIPRHLNIEEAFNTISPLKDVDGFHPTNAGNLILGKAKFVPCTPLGVIRLLKEYNIEIAGKNAVVIGRSNIVGKPMASLLLNEDATVTICHSRTKNLSEITKTADILVSAIGKPKFITKDMIKDGAVVVDVGINRLEDGHIVGDVDFENVKEIASYITPVPGGVGPMTIAMLIENVILAGGLERKLNEGSTTNTHN